MKKGASAQRQHKIELKAKAPIQSRHMAEPRTPPRRFRGTRRPDAVSPSGLLARCNLCYYAHGPWTHRGGAVTCVVCETIDQGDLHYCTEEHSHLIKGQIDFLAIAWDDALDTEQVDRPATVQQRIKFDRNEPKYLCDDHFEQMAGNKCANPRCERRCDDSTYLHNWWCTGKRDRHGWWRKCCSRKCLRVHHKP